jgi:hypothetical protein
MAIALLAFTASCISDDNRCGPGQIYITDVEEGKKYYCYDPNAIPDAGPETDAGEPGEDGLGEPCNDPSDCANYSADYCAGQPGAEGYCSISDCVVEPDSCPEGYHCCDFEINSDKFCVTPEDLNAMGGMCRR